MIPLRRTTDATCAGCGCTCDDIILHDDGIRVTRAENACALGRTWFDQQSVEATHQTASIDGRESSFVDAVEAAADLLHRADMPLIFGLGRASCEAQRQAVHLAELIGGTIDTETSLSHDAMEMAAQLGGKITCTLGELKNRADLIIYWGANPVESHPRHFERYTATAAGKFLPRGRADRTLVVVDTKMTTSAAAADIFLHIRPNKDFEALTVLRAMVLGHRFDETMLGDTGLSVEQLRDLAARMKRARYGAIFAGLGLFRTRGHYMNCAAATALVIELNSVARFISMPLRDPGNLAGADAILSYTTGHPFGVNFSRGYPRYNPGEFTASELLSGGEPDAAVIVGTQSLAMLPVAARAHLTRIPKVVLDQQLPTSGMAVHFATAVCGITAPGTVYRMDKVPLTMRPPLSSPYASDEVVLRSICETVARKIDTYPTAAAAMPLV